MKTLESRKRTNSNTACPKSNSTSFESCRTTGTKQRNVKQNTRGKQKWKVARLEKARERLRGGVCYFANNPAENFHFDREKRRWKGGGGWRGYTSHCGYRPDNAILTRLAALWKCHCVLSSRSPAFTNLLYTPNSSCFLRLFRGYDGETFFAPPESCPRELQILVAVARWEFRAVEFVSMDFQNK